MPTTADARALPTDDDCDLLEHVLIRSMRTGQPAVLTPRQSRLAFELMNHAAASANIISRLEVVDDYTALLFPALTAAYDKSFPEWRDYFGPLDG